MAILIVGGDYVTSFKHLVANQHSMQIEHWDGRKKEFNKRSLPNKIRLVVVICDYVSHRLALSIKEKAKQRGIPLVFCHRSVNELKHKLQHIYQTDQDCCWNRVWVNKNDQFQGFH